MALRPEESEEDIRRSMRLVLFVFFSFSSLEELAVGGGDSESLGVRLPVERRLLTDSDRL